MSAVIIFNDNNFSGDSLAVDGDIFDFSATRFNDQGSSIIINQGTWEFCTDANFQGQCKILGQGQYPSVQDVGIPNDSISSVRRRG
ncbi:MAG: beta/gamma crystallin family protein [Rhizonema sp. PD37]|nr:beta/gamma crystallin family protein [Rhizonema sp. PD37]